MKQDLALVKVIMVDTVNLTMVKIFDTQLFSKQRKLSIILSITQHTQYKLSNDKNAMAIHLFSVIDHLFMISQIHHSAQIPFVMTQELFFFFSIFSAVGSAPSAATHYHWITTICLSLPCFLLDSLWLNTTMHKQTQLGPFKMLRVLFLAVPAKNCLPH